jgi:hypothetical protein
MKEEDKDFVSHMIMHTREDLAIFRVVVDAGLSPTSPVLRALWRWFGNIDLPIPLTVVPLESKERATLSKSILSEMDELLIVLGNKSKGMRSEDVYERITTSKEASLVDNLWRDLACVYAWEINQMIPRLSEEDKIARTDIILENLSQELGINRSEVIEQIKQTPSLRLSFRVEGLNPDEII